MAGSSGSELPGLSLFPVSRLPSKQKGRAPSNWQIRSRSANRSKTIARSPRKRICRRISRTNRSVLGAVEACSVPSSKTNHSARALSLAGGALPNAGNYRHHRARPSQRRSNEHIRRLRSDVPNEQPPRMGRTFLERRSKKRRRNQRLAAQVVYVWEP